MSVISAIKSNWGKYLARGTGIVALGLVARDAHSYGKIVSNAYVKTKDAQVDQYLAENMIMCDKPSKTKSDMQKAIFNFDVEHGFRGFINSFIGYLKGSFSSLVSDVVPFALGLTALLAKNKFIAKTSAVGLAVLALCSFFKDGLGVGKARQNALPQ